MDNPDYVRSVQLLREHHRLMERGEGESDAAEAIREETHDLWPQLSPDEQDFLGGLSADLYMLEGDEVPEPGGSEAITPGQLRACIAEALSRQDWPALLKLFRKAPDILPAAQVAYLRARAYDALRHLDVAIDFLKYAIGQDPGNYDYRYLLLEMLIRAGKQDEASDVAAQHLADVQSPPDLRMQAGAVLFLHSKNLPVAEARPLLERAALVLEDAVAQAESDPNLSFDSAYAWLSVGYCQEALGDIDAARRAYERSVELVPGFHEGQSALARIDAISDLAGAIAALAHSHSPINLEKSGAQEYSEAA